MSHNPLKFLFQYILLYKKYYVPILIFYCIGRICWHLTSFFLGQIIDFINTETIDWAAVYWNVAGLIGLCLVLRGILFRVMEVISELYAEPRILQQIREDLFAKLKIQSISYFHDHFSGQLADKVSNVVNDSHSLMQSLLHTVYPTVISYFIITILLFTVSPMFATVFVLWAGFMIGGAFLITRRILVLSDEEAEKRSRLGGFLVDVLTNMPSIMLFSGMQREGQSFHRHTQLRVTP